MTDKQYVADVLTKFTPINGLDVPASDNTLEIAEGLLSNPNIIFCGEPGKGLIMGIVYPYFANPNIIIAQELGWWVEPEYRKSTLAYRLINSFEQEAKNRGAHKIIMICLHTQKPTEIGRLYVKKGYKPLEYSFIKGV